MMNNLRKIQPPVFPVEKVEIPEAETFSLNNGIPVFLIESGTEDIMRMEFTFRAGQVMENQPLLASATNMMLSEGSKNYTSEELNRKLDYYGAFLHHDTDRDRAEVVLYFLSKYAGRIIELCHEIIYNPVFPENELKALMNKRLRWYMVNREKVNKLAEYQFFESIFGKTHPYGYQIKEEDFFNISSEMLRDFHTKFYAPENMAIIISGRIHDNTTEFLNEHFGSLENGVFINHDQNRSLYGEPGKKMFVYKPGAIQTAIRIGSATINKRHPDYPGLKILDSVLGGYFGSRLMKNIREDKGYTYGIHSSVSSLDLSGYKMISTEVGNKNYKKAIEEIYREIDNLQNTPPEKSEMDVVRNYMSGEMLRMFDGPFALAESFKAIWAFGLDNKYYQRLAEKIRMIEADEIMSLARTYYKIEDLYEVSSGDE